MEVRVREEGAAAKTRSCYQNKMLLPKEFLNRTIDLGFGDQLNSLSQIP